MDRSTLKDTSAWAKKLAREQAKTIQDFQLVDESLEKYLYVSLVEAVLQLQPVAPKRQKISSALISFIRRLT